MNKENLEIKNAIIESVSIDDGGRGLLTSWLHLDYGGYSQSFGGYSLYLPKSFIHHGGPNFAGHFIFRCMEIAGVDSWSKIIGKTIRVKSDNIRVYAIGHIVKDNWFCPEEDFEKMKQKPS